MIALFVFRPDWSFLLVFLAFFKVLAFKVTWDQSRKQQEIFRGSLLRMKIPNFNRNWSYSVLGFDEGIDPVISNGKSKDLIKQLKFPHVNK